MEFYNANRFLFLNFLRYIDTSYNRKEMNDTNGIREAAVRAEYEVIRAAMEKNHFSKTKAAAELGIDRKTLYTKLNAYYKLVGKGVSSDKS
jgi:transcriptional regulator with PAS, ATPase and Fis domain